LRLCLQASEIGNAGINVFQFTGQSLYLVLDLILLLDLILQGIQTSAVTARDRSYPDVSGSGLQRDSITGLLGGNGTTEAANVYGRSIPSRMTHNGASVIMILNHGRPLFLCPRPRILTRGALTKWAAAVQFNRMH
jgi:hypothetical protein